MIKPLLFGSGMVLAIGLVSVGGIRYIQAQQKPLESVASNGKPILLTTTSSPTVDNSYSVAIGKSDDATKPAETGTLKVLNEGKSQPVNNSANNVSGPENFAEYEKYKDQTTALFGDLKIGDGAVAEVNRTATVQYRGWLTNGTEFDQSYSKGQPFIFTIGEHRVILGWEQAIVGMKVGGKRRFIVPPAVGYGAENKNGIPSNSVLIFDVELLMVK